MSALSVFKNTALSGSIRFFVRLSDPVGSAEAEKLALGLTLATRTAIPGQEHTHDLSTLHQPQTSINSENDDYLVDWNGVVDAEDPKNFPSWMKSLIAFQVKCVRMHKHQPSDLTYSRSAS